MKDLRQELIDFKKWHSKYIEQDHSELHEAFIVDKYLKSINSGANTEKEKICPHCNGKGFIYINKNYEIVCSVCSGSGKSGSLIQKFQV